MEQVDIKQYQIHLMIANVALSTTLVLAFLFEFYAFNLSPILLIIVGLAIFITSVLSIKCYIDSNNEIKESLNKLARAVDYTNEITNIDEVINAIREQLNDYEEMRTNNIRYSTLINNLPQQLILTDDSGDIIIKNDVLDNKTIELGLLEIKKTGQEEANFIESGHNYTLRNKLFKIGESKFRVTTMLRHSDALSIIDVIDSVKNNVMLGITEQRIDIDALPAHDQRLANKINETLHIFNVFFADIQHHLESISKGYLKEIKSDHLQGEIRAIMDSYNLLVLSLKDYSSQIREASDTLGDSANEIARGNLDLNRRTEQQSMFLSESAESMHELAIIVKENANQADEVVQISESAKSYAEKGGQIVNETQSAINEISERSQKIADIISVINDIAFQTNLLALNAAVEAARAGEHGRGFAVVATEVRNLSQRTTQAAKEIKSLIENSVKSVDNGVELIEKSHGALEQILSAASSVSERVIQMAQQSLMQSSGIEQVNDNLKRINEYNSHNSALVEEVAAASEAMDNQFELVSNIISFFKSDEESSNSQPIVDEGKDLPPASDGENIEDML